MSQDEYDLKPPDSASLGLSAAPKPGEPGWVPPEPVIENAESAESEPAMDPDVQHFKYLAAAGYVCFLLPLLLAPQSRFARYHANQGLLLFILLSFVVALVILLHLGVLLVGVVFRKIGILDFFFSGGFHLLQAALLISWVALLFYGMVQAVNGQCKPLPAIGHRILIK